MYAASAFSSYDIRMRKRAGPACIPLLAGTCYIAAVKTVSVRGSFKAYLVPGELAALRMELSLPDGRAYVGSLRPHATDTADLWFEGFVSALDVYTAARDEILNADGAMPAVAPPRMDLWPCQLKLNLAPSFRPGDGEYHGKLWVSATNGRPGGEIYAVVADATEESGFTGWVAAYCARHR